MKDNKEAAKVLLKFQVNRKILGLSKNILIQLEDANVAPDEFQRLRKRILDYSNDAIRELESTIDKLQIDI